MAISKLFNVNIEKSNLLKSIQVGQTYKLEVAEGTGAQEAFNSITASSVCRKKNPSSKKDQLKIDVQLEIMTAISGQAMDHLSKLLKITKTSEYYV